MAKKDEEEEDFDLKEEMSTGICISDQGYLSMAVCVSAEGKFLKGSLTWDAALLFIENWMEEKKYWPNVFYVNDHGNVDWLRLKSKKVKGKTIKVTSTVIRSWV